jgi:putative peptidoglycan lipid II flippase
MTGGKAGNGVDPDRGRPEERPGRQAGPTADDGGLDPRRGAYPGNGMTGVKAGHGLDPDRGRPEERPRNTGAPGPGPRSTPPPGPQPPDRAPNTAPAWPQTHGRPPNTGAPGPPNTGRTRNAGAPDPPNTGRPRNVGAPGPATPGRPRNPGAPGPQPPSRTRNAGAPGPRPPDRTRPRHAAGAWPGPSFGPSHDPLTGAEIQAWIARTVENARTSRNVRAAGPGRGPGRTAEAGAAAASSLLRSSGAMAVGTLASRVTGFLRSAILIYAIGTHDLGNAYNVANTLPNIVYNLALGGILTSVVVPLLVNAAKRDRDRGEAYDQRIFTLGVLALGGITVVATAAAVPIASVYAGNIGDPGTYHLTVIFAYFFIPQIFFYGVSSLAGAILNARGSFAAPMWTPVINNMVVILVGLAFIATAGLNKTPTNISGGEIQLLGLGTTLGIVLQTVALIPSLRKVRFRWRPRYDFQGAEVSEIGRMSGWMFGYVLTTQIAFLVTTRVANSAGARVSQHAAGAGFAAYSNAYMLFQLPYAIVGISVITAMLPRMSAHAAEGRYRLVSSDFSTAARLASVVVVPAALILAVLGGPLAEGVFGYGSTSAASARYVGEIFAVFSLGLLPFTLFQLLLRVFYAMHDSRTPALISVVTMAINITANLIALAVLPPQHVVAGLGAGFGLASVAGTVAAWRVLGRRVGSLDGYEIRASLVRMHAAAIPGAVFAIAVSVMVGAVFSGGRIGALLTVAIGGSGATFLYLLFAKAFGVRELTSLIATVRARLR